MKNLGSVVATLLLIATQSHAQVGFGGIIPGPGTVHSAGGGGYTGPGDLNSGWALWWGARAYNASQASAGANAFQLCTASDAACTNIRVTSTGGLNSSDLTTSGCSGISTCTVKIKYDQSGNGRDLTQNTIGSRDTFDPAANGGKGQFVTGSASHYVTAGTYTRSQPFVMSVVAQRVGGTGERQELLDYNNQGVRIKFNGGTANQVAYTSGSNVNATASDSAFHSLTALFNGSSSITSVDSTVSTGQVLGSNGLNDNIAWTCYSGCGGNTQTTYQMEAGIYPGSMTSGDITALNSNQKTYWGF